MRGVRRGWSRRSGSCGVESNLERWIEQMIRGDLLKSLEWVGEVAEREGGESEAWSAVWMSSEQVTRLIQAACSRQMMSQGAMNKLCMYLRVYDAPCNGRERVSQRPRLKREIGTIINRQSSIIMLEFLPFGSLKMKGASVEVLERTSGMRQRCSFICCDDKSGYRVCQGVVCW